MPGLAKYFKDGSDEERDHAQLLITFQVSFYLDCFDLFFAMFHIFEHIPHLHSSLEGII